MKEIENKIWKEKDEKGKDVDIKLVKLLEICINQAIGKDLPQGIEGFKIMTRLTEALDKAGETGKIVLEDKDYLLIKSAVEKNLNPYLAKNKDIVEVVEYFLSFK